MPAPPSVAWKLPLHTHPPQPLPPPASLAHSLHLCVAGTRDLVLRFLTSVTAVSAGPVLLVSFYSSLESAVVSTVLTPGFIAAGRHPTVHSRLHTFWGTSADVNQSQVVCARARGITSGALPQAWRGLRSSSGMKSLTRTVRAPATVGVVPGALPAGSLCKAGNTPIGYPHLL